MVQTQFFTREKSWIKSYKSNFILALGKAKVVSLFSSEVINFLEKWLKKQTSYIPRDDIDNFLPNMKLIFKDKNFYDFVIKVLEKVKSNWNILEYSFSLISELDEARKSFGKKEEEKLKKENLEKAELESKNEDKKKLEEMEKMFGNL